QGGADLRAAVEFLRLFPHTNQGRQLLLCRCIHAALRTLSPAFMPRTRPAAACNCKAISSASSAVTMYRAENAPPQAFRCTQAGTLGRLLLKATTCSRLFSAGFSSGCSAVP